MIRRIIIASWLILAASEGPRLVAADPPFTFVIMPDTQNMVQSFGSVYMSACQWIVDNRVSENIVAVLTVGDLVNNPTVVQFSTSSAGLALIEATGIPVIPVVGNHDYTGSNPAGRSLTRFDQYYGPAHFAGKPWYRGGYQGSNGNYYCTFDVGNRKFMVVALEFYPRPAVVSFASGIIDANPDRETIVLTHGYLYSNGSRILDTTTQGPNSHGMPAEDASGEEIWTNLIRSKPNVRAVFSGHVANSTHSARRTDLGDMGNLIHQVLINYQTNPNGGDGWIGLLKFQPDQGNAQMRHYRTWPPSGLGDDPNVPTFTLDWAAITAPPPPQPTPPHSAGFSPLFSPLKGESVTVPIDNAQPAHVKARVIDRTGALVKSVADADVAAGGYVTWDGRNESNKVVASGVYTLIIEINGKLQTRKIIVRK